jgi:hypothetical protein
VILSQHFYFQLIVKCFVVFEYAGFGSSAFTCFSSKLPRYMPHVLAMVTLHLQHIAFAAALMHISCQLEAKWWHWHRGW